MLLTPIFGQCGSLAVLGWSVFVSPATCACLWVGEVVRLTAIMSFFYLDTTQKPATTSSESK